MIDPLTFHEKFSLKDFDFQYNLRVKRPDYETTVIPNWVERSRVAREKLNTIVDQRYGEGEKQKLDVFRVKDPNAPTLVYFHGGYWQRGDKSIYSFLASPFNSEGVNFITVGYDLCPTVSITQISNQAREALDFIWRNAKSLGVNRDQITVMGHSAGGHITQMMMGTKWAEFSAGLPADLVTAGIPISPLSYLEPVRLTEALNAGIGMTVAEAESQSPMVAHPPSTNASQLVAVGGNETEEFHRQAQMYVDTFSSGDRSMEIYVVPDADHFDELNVLADLNSPFFSKTLDIVRSTNRF
ncbi:MAG: alpha/beta hydrolase [Rhodospirillaceae bacterium]|nr:alpha/beta hydrolase [Rhodospirillaceae bacterium]